jgi:hypothetical protein
MAETYTKLFNTIITSSIWSEDAVTCKVWITLLAMADFKGQVFGSMIGIADMARIDVKDCEIAFKKLLSPDKYSRTQAEEGRRVRVIEGGWEIINYEFYRDKRGSRAEYFRKYRERKCKSATVARNTMQPSATHTDTDTYNNLFVQFWNAYPKHRAKKVAFKAFCKLQMTDELFATIISAVEAQKKTQDWRKEGGQYIPLASTWLNQARWEDEIEIKRSPDNAGRQCPKCGRYLNSSGDCYCGYQQT